MSYSRTRTGFTLIEIVMVIALVGILAGVMAPPIVAMADALYFDRVRNEIVGMGQGAFERLVIDIRRLSGAGAILAADPDHYRFFDVDGVTVDISRNTTNSTLILNRNGVDHILSAYVSDLSFTYYNSESGHNPLAAPFNAALIRNIRVSLTLDRGLGPAGQVSLETEIRPPNLQRVGDLFP